jgi:Cu/Zn superoxide dismutase
MTKHPWLCSLFALAACGSDDDSMPTATSAITGFMGGTMTGTATFTQDGDDVTVDLTLDGCAAGKAYPVHIHQGTSCADATAQGGHWDMTRGEGIPNIACNGTTGASHHTRVATPPETAWSIGGDATTDVVGHVIVVHDADTPTNRIACGAIAL